MIKKDQQKIALMIEKRNKWIIAMIDAGEKPAFVGYVMSISRQMVEKIYSRGVK